MCLLSKLNPVKPEPGFLFNIHKLQMSKLLLVSITVGAVFMIVHISNSVL